MLRARQQQQQLRPRLLRGDCQRAPGATARGSADVPLTLRAATLCCRLGATSISLRSLTSAAGQWCS